VLSVVIFVDRDGLRWRYASIDHGPHKTLYNPWKRWSDKGVLAGIIVGIAAGDTKKDANDQRHVSQGTPISLQHRRQERGRGRLIGRTKGGGTIARRPMLALPRGAFLYAICYSGGRPFNLFVKAGQVVDCIGARALLESVPDVEWLLGDHGQDADWFSEVVQENWTVG
jgi:transposase